MNILPRKSCRIGCRFLSIFLPVILLMFTGFTAPSTAQNRLLFKVPEGETFRATVGIRNVCRQPHVFRATFKSGGERARFEAPAEAIQVAAFERKELGVIFNAANLEQKVYRGVLQWECIDCKDKKKCNIPKSEVPYEMLVIEGQEVTQLASKYRNILSEELAKSAAVVEDDSRTKLNEVLRNGASVLINSGAKGRIKESYDNLKKLAAALIANAEKRKKSAGTGFAAHFMPDDEQLVITEKSMNTALDSVCPLFPFCS